MSGAGPQALVFDLDGTLIDSAPDICAMANALLAEEGIDRVSLAEARGFVGAGADAFVRRMRAARGIPEADHARLLARFLELYEGAVAHSVIYPGVLDALTLFAAKGHALAVCTNKPIRPTHIVLDHFEMRGRFGAVIGGDTLPVRKPDPAPIHAAFAALGAETGLYVGDSEVDADAAARAGVPFLLFTEGYRKTPVAEMPHDAAFSHWDELPALIERLTVRVA
ncbi:MAG: phosphoglycolate phosphatase [Pseudomonadota bacterium]